MTNGRLHAAEEVGWGLVIVVTGGKAEQASSMNGPEKPCNTKHQQRNLKPVLQRPVEAAAQTGPSPRYGAMTELRDFSDL